MKKLLLFALLCVPAFGQVHSDIATQNTVGNWVKAIPGAFIYVCTPNTADASCLTGLGGTTLFTDSGLTFTVTPPIVADSNGNYTFYATPGIYKQCVKAATSFCQLIEVAGIGTPVGVPFTCPSAVNGSVMGMTSTTTSSCDPNGITDFIGHWTSQSYRATGSFNGTVELTGGLADPTNPPDTNSVALLAPLTVPTPYYLRPPASTGTVGQCLQLLTQDSGTNGIIDALQWATCAAGAGTVTSFSAGNLSPLFTTSVATATSTPALTFSLTNAAANTVFGNFTGSSAAPSYNAISACGDSTHALAWTAGTGFTCQAISAGSAVSITATSPVVVTPTPITGTGVVSCPNCVAYTAASNPSAPTLTPNTPGSTAYSYAVVGCEDVNCAFHSAMSGVTATSTGNANLATGTMKITAYGDTLYGYRFFKVCRTASAGLPASTGVIATGAGKSFIDNGLAGDSSNCASVYASNTTQLDTHCIASANPAGINVMPGAPCGVDAPPTTPNALDDEAGPIFGAPGDANNSIVWTWVNQGSCTATWTSGMISMSCPTDGGAAYHCLMATAPGTPYTFKGLIYWNNTQTSNEVGAFIGGLGLRESATGKAIIYGTYSQNTNHPAEAAVSKYSNTTTLASQVVSIAGTGTNPFVYTVQNTGTNTVYTSSPDGSVFNTTLSEAKNTFFTTGPDQYGMCLNAFGGTSTMEVDYLRRTQ